MRDFSKKVGVYMERILQMHEKVVTEINCTEHREENGIKKTPFQYLPFVSKNQTPEKEQFQVLPLPQNPRVRSKSTDSPLQSSKMYKNHHLPLSRPTTLRSTPHTPGPRRRRSIPSKSPRCSHPLSTITPRSTPSLSYRSKSGFPVNRRVQKLWDIGVLRGC